MATSNTNLTNIQYTQLNPMTWCATAQVSQNIPVKAKYLWHELSAQTVHVHDAENKNSQILCEFSWQYYTPTEKSSVRDIARNQRQLQRKGVRLLLQQLLNKLALNDILDESDFPYQLVDSNYYVCFSHTGANHNDVNRKLSQKINPALDSEVAVVISHQRPSGIDIETSSVAWHVAKRFYSDNEIAVLQSLSVLERTTIAKLLWQIKESFIKIHQYKLAQGLGVDYSYLIGDLIDTIREQAPLGVLTDHKSLYQIAVLSMQQTVIVF